MQTSYSTFIYLDYLVFNANSVVNVFAIYWDVEVKSPAIDVVKIFGWVEQILVVDADFKNI